MALKGAIYHRPEYKPSTPSQNQTGGTNHGSNGLRDEYDNPEDLYEDIRRYNALPLSQKQERILFENFSFRYLRFDLKMSVVK